MSLITQAVTYIDPYYTGVSNGTIEQPFKVMPAITSDNVYLFKTNTVYTTNNQIYVNGVSNVKIGYYGKGTRPKFSYRGTGYAIRIVNSDNITIEGLEVDGNGNAHSLIGIIGGNNRYLSNISIIWCVLHNAHNPNNAGFGIHAFYTNNLSVQYTTIRNVALDGMYLRYCINTNLGYGTIHDINRRYFLNTNQTYSSGDGIQFDGNYDGFYLHHYVIARTNGAGNKFGVIIASAPSVSDNAKGIIEYCEFETDGTVTTSLHIERGNGIIVRYNKFLGITQAIRIGGAYAKNTKIYNNEFENCTNGIGVGYTYPNVGAAVGTEIRNNIFVNITKYHVWVDKSIVYIEGNQHFGADGSIHYYNYGGGGFIDK